MEQAEYDSLCRKADALARANYRAYWRYALGWAFLGTFLYLTLLLLFLAAIALVVTYLILIRNLWSLATWLTLLFLIPAVVMLASMFRRIPEPGGRRILPVEAPALFQSITQVGERLGAPQTDCVVLTLLLEAFAADHKKFGCLGRRRLYIGLGLPLLLALREDEMRSVIAHEVAHHCRHDPFRTQLVTHATIWWQTLAENEATRRYATKFTHWYTPRLEAVTNALRRQGELAADKMEASVMGPDIVRNSLVRLVIAESKSKQGWDRRSLLYANHEEPPDDHYKELEDLYQEPINESDIRKLAIELLRTTLPTSSHPCLRERLENIGIRLPNDHTEAAQMLVGSLPAVEVSAARSLLGDHYDSLLEEAGEAWKEAERSDWSERHLEAKHISEIIEEIGSLDQIARLPKDEALDVIRWLVKTCRFEEAESASRILAECYPGSPEVCMSLGYSLLHQQKHEALYWLQMAGDLDPFWRAPALDGVATYHQVCGMSDDAYQIAWEARRAASSLDQLLDDLLKAKDSKWRKIEDDDTETQISSALSHRKDVLAVYIAERFNPRLTDQKPKVIVIVLEPTFLGTVTDSQIESVVANLQGLRLVNYFVKVGDRQLKWRLSLRHEGITAALLRKKSGTGLEKRTEKRSRL